MNKKLNKLIEKFKEIENQLVEILDEKPFVLDESLNSAESKKAIKDYIKKVNKAKKLFNQYEELAKQIEDITADEGDSASMSRVVFELGDINTFDHNEDMEKVEEKEELSEKETSNKKNKKDKKEKVKEF